MRKTFKRSISIILVLILILILFALPVEAASTFSITFGDNPQMTSRIREIALKHEMVPSEQTEVLLPIYWNYKFEWVDGYSWEEIRDKAITMEKNRYLVVNKTKGLVYYGTMNDQNHYTEQTLKGTRKFAAERVLDMKNGYRYEGKTYDVENIYWFDQYGHGKGSYVAIETEAGTFFEYYNRPFGDDEQTVLTFTQTEFEEWYPEFMRPSVESSRGLLGSGGENDEFDTFLLANGFTPRYGEAQGVTRRVLTYGGIGLAGAAIIGGTTYMVVRHKRKKQSEPLEIKEAEIAS